MYLDPGENCENIKYHEPAKGKGEDSDILSSPSFLSSASKPRPRPKLTGVDQLFLFIMVKTWLRLPDTSLNGRILFTLS